MNTAHYIFTDYFPKTIKTFLLAKEAASGGANVTKVYFQQVQAQIEDLQGSIERLINMNADDMDAKFQGLELYIYGLSGLT